VRCMMNLEITQSTKTGNLVLRRHGLRTFAELDERGKIVGYFAEVHTGAPTAAPPKTGIKRPRMNEAVPVTAFLKSRPAKDRKDIKEDSMTAKVADLCHKLLASKKTKRSRGDLKAAAAEHLGITLTQAQTSISALLHVYDHLEVRE